MNFNAETRNNTEWLIVWRTWEKLYAFQLLLSMQNRVTNSKTETADEQQHFKNAIAC